MWMANLRPDSRRWSLTPTNYCEESYIWNRMGIRFILRKGAKMFLTPDREVVNRIGATLSRQLADAESQLAQLQKDSPQQEQLHLQMGQLRRATIRFDHLMDMLNEKLPPTTSPHFDVGIRGIVEKLQ